MSASDTNKLAGLIQKIDAFVNGPADQIIATNRGSIRTLSGLSEQMKSISYVQTIYEFNNLSELLASDLQDGELARVTIDLNRKNNGIYQKLPLGFRKTSYEDLYDLHDRLPNPWNKVECKFDEKDSVSNIKLINGLIAVSNAEVASTSLKAVLEYNLDAGGGLTYALHAEYLVSIFAKGYGAFSGQVTPIVSNTFSPSSFVPQNPPVLSLVHSIVNSDHSFDLILSPASNASEILPGNGRVLLKEIDLEVWAVEQR